MAAAFAAKRICFCICIHIYIYIHHAHILNVWAQLYVCKLAICFVMRAQCPMSLDCWLLSARPTFRVIEKTEHKFNQTNTYSICCVCLYPYICNVPIACVLSLFTYLYQCPKYNQNQNDIIPQPKVFFSTLLVLVSFSQLYLAFT